MVAFCFRERRAGGQAKALVEKPLADLAAVHLGLGEDGLEVHRFPDWPSFDILRLKREPDLLAGDSGDLGVDGQAG